MARDELAREYGVILGVTGPIMMERILCYREMARVIREKLGDDSQAAGWMEMQATRAEETIVQLARKFDARTK